MLLLRVFLPFAAAYLLAYLLRVVNAVAGAPLRAEMGLSTSQLGLVTSVYFFGFALSQIPLGVMMDRYGPRRVQASVLLVAALGCVLFALAADFGDLLVGRALMGVGASMSLMAPFTAYRHWFSAQHMPIVVGIHTACGALGASLGGGPTEWLIAEVGWRGVFVLLAGLVLVASALVFAAVPRRHEPTVGVPVGRLVREMGRILTSRGLWRIAPVAASSQAGMLSIVSLWTGPWLRDVAGMSPATAATWLSIISGGLVFGFVFWGIVAGRAARAGRMLDVVIAGSLTYTLIGLFIIVLPPERAAPLWIVYIATGAVGAQSYGVATAVFAPEMAGRVNTALNFMVFFFAFLVQWGFGVLLDLFAGPDGAATRLGFQVALGALLGIQILSYLPLLLMRGSVTRELGPAG